MLKETRITQVAPNDEVINNTIKTYQIFGWELVNNQRCQEYVESDETYSTYNKLTFTRDQETVHYQEVATLEAEYLQLQDQREHFERLGNQNCVDFLLRAHRTMPHHPRFNVFACIICFLLAIIPGIIYVSHYQRRVAKYEKAMSVWKPQLDELARIQARIDQIVLDVGTLVS